MAWVNIFVKHRRKTICVMIVFLLVLSLAVLEIALRLLGLGDPILYDSNPVYVYGFRPLPNRTYMRFNNSRVSFNNLSLRTDEPWHDRTSNKILFLGDSITYGGSHIDNVDLFSNRIQQELNGYQCGNGAVNSWGVENIYALIVESEFLPAQVYVTVLIEGDFYRGLTRCQGMPFFNRAPRLALEELWRHFCWLQNNRRYRYWTTFTDDAGTRKVVDKAVRKLVDMDSFLKFKGFTHYIFISPCERQLDGSQEIDPLVAELLSEHKLSVVYIQHLLDRAPLKSAEVPDFYQDGFHLTRKGHAAWADAIADELKRHLPALPPSDDTESGAKGK